MHEEMPTDTKTLFGVLQSTQQLDVSGLQWQSVFSSWDTYGFFVGFLKFLPQCPCEDLGQSQVPEGFSGTEAAVWVCPSPISYPLSCEYFWMYFTQP